MSVYKNVELLLEGCHIFTSLNKIIVCFNRVLKLFIIQLLEIIMAGNNFLDVSIRKRLFSVISQKVAKSMVRSC